MRWMLLFGLSLLWLTACQTEDSAQGEKSVSEIRTEGKIRNSDIIRNPVSAMAPEDTVNVPKIEFEEMAFDFGEVKEGEIVTHIFRFTNTGKMPLIIQSARSTCGCTVPEWSKDPIPPGGRGEVSVKFDTENKKEKQTKPVTITANTYPAVTRIFLTGYVHPVADEGTAIQ